MSKEKKGASKSTYILLAVGIIAAVLIFVLPPPSGISVTAWRVSGLLIPTVMVWATEAMPVGVASVWFLALVVAFRLVKADIAFGGFLEHLTWLMMGAFAVATAMEKTGFSKRMTYFLLSRAKGLWGLIGAAYLANCFLLAVPSSAARSGILAPVLSSIMETLDRPMQSNFSRLLTYHFCMATNAFTGIMFLTGGAANPVMLGLFTQLTGNTLNWNQWLVVMFVPVLVFTGIILLGSLLWGMPEKDLVDRIRSSEATRKAYEALGPMTKDEWKVLAAFVLAVFLWVIGSAIRLQPGFAAVIVMGLLFLPGVGVLSGKDLGKLNWNIILLLGAVMGLGGILKHTGLTDVLARLIIAPIMDPCFSFGLIGLGIGVVVISFIVHFILPSPNNLTLAVPLLVAWGLKVGLSPAMALAFLGIMSLIGDKVVPLAYMMPPYYVYLGMNVTDTGRFNQLLVRMYPIAAFAMLIAAFLLYAFINMTGYGA